MDGKTGVLLLIICLSYLIQGSVEQQNTTNFAESEPQSDAASVLRQRESFLTMSKSSTIKRLYDLSKRRAKRSSVFPTGVKVCPQESEKQILASHLAYYRLRVCQEAVWEAYRIFLDRIPYTPEYQYWVDACQKDTFCLFDIGKNFSNSEEHLTIIQRRVKERSFEESKEMLTTEKTVSDTGNPEEYDTVSLDTPPTTIASTPNEPLLNEIVNDTKSLLKELEVTNTVPEQPTEQMVEFTVTLTKQKFTPELNDPSSVPYQELAADFQLKMQKVFEKLPGVKEIRVIRFRQKKEEDGSSSIVVSYAVMFQRGRSETKKDSEEIPVIASNKVENGKGLEEAGAKSTTALKYTVTELQEMVATALQDDRSLPVDLRTLRFVQDMNKPSIEKDNDILPLMTINEASPELDDALNAERPLENPSPDTKEQTDDLTSEHTTSELMLEQNSNYPGVSRNDISSNAIEGFSEETNTESLDRTDDFATSLTTESLSGQVTDSEESSGDSLHFETSTDAVPLPSFSHPSFPSVHPYTIFSADEILTIASSFVPTETFALSSDLRDGSSSMDSSDVERATDSMLTPQSAAGVEALVSPMITPEMITKLEDSKEEELATSSASSFSHSVIDQSFFHSFPSPTPTTSSSPTLGGTILPNFAVGVQDIAVELDKIESGSAAPTDELDQESAYILVSETQSVETTATPSLMYLTTSSLTTTAKGKELVVFFSLRVTNMAFSDDLFNRSSLEYKALEQQLTQLLLPYLRSNLTGFKQLEILNFRKGSVIVNSKMKFAKSVPYNITEAVHCVLEDFCDAAAQRLNLEIDSYSLDVEPADQADPCKFMACDAFSECIMNSWTKEADCLCKPGYVSMDGLPCQSLCELEPNLCVNEGKCEIVSGKGAVCRSPEETNSS
ncbi:interphotoreceptor matrix proteoglycan 1 isoform X3 [Pleurodeles waltl]|uniref:interphotoreceptor matrix proteoglycan 1 isoform X3 n=1 Tax=Pleurodeles waltl TaxID=8319 RepID=UPI0037097930